jgi:hypothetical protein
MVVVWAQVTSGTVEVTTYFSTPLIKLAKGSISLFGQNSAVLG